MPGSCREEKVKKRLSEPIGGGLKSPLYFMEKLEGRDRKVGHPSCDDAVECEFDPPLEADQIETFLGSIQSASNP